MPSSMYDKAVSGKSQHGSNRLRDYGLYALISLGIIAGVVAAAELKVPRNTFERWFGGAMFSAFLFGQFLENSRQLWKKRLFWVCTGVRLLAHCVVLRALFLRGTLPRSSGSWVLLVCVEGFILICFRAMLRRISE